MRYTRTLSIPLSPLLPLLPLGPAVQRSSVAGIAHSSRRGLTTSSFDPPSSSSRIPSSYPSISSASTFTTLTTNYPSRVQTRCAQRCFSTSVTARVQDHYGALKLPKNASKQQVKARFYELSKKYHPDAPGGSPEKFHTINDAYAVLGDDAKRRTYDQSITPASSSSSTSRTPHAHRAWSRRPPPLYRHPSSSARRAPSDLGSGLGMNGAPGGAWGSSSSTSSGSNGPGTGSTFGAGGWTHHRSTPGAKAREARMRQAAQHEEGVRGESAVWRFGAVVLLLFVIVGFGGGFNASADAGEERGSEEGEEEKRGDLDQNQRARVRV